MRRLFPTLFTAVVGLPVLLVTGWESGWTGLALGAGLLALGFALVAYREGLS